MALDRASHFPGRWDAVTAAHPQGAFKNRSAPAAGDGSYIHKDWANDWDGFFSSLLDGAALAPNGLIDEVGASQYYDALIALTSDPETIRDIVVAMLTQGDGILLSEDDGANTLTISLDEEFTRDLVALFITNGSGITITHDDPGDTLTIAVNDEYFIDLIDDTIIGGDGIDKVKNDGANTTTLSINDEYVRDLIATTYVAGTGISIVTNDGANTTTISNTNPISRIVTAAGTHTSSKFALSNSAHDFSNGDNITPTTANSALILSDTINLTSSGNRCYVTVSVPVVGFTGSSNQSLMICLFRGTDCIAIGTSYDGEGTDWLSAPVSFNYRDSPGVAGNVSYSIRAMQGPSTTAHLNAWGHTFGGSTIGGGRGRISLTMYEVDD